MTNNILKEIIIILFIALLIGFFYNMSNPKKLPFVAEEKIIDFAQSDSLLIALRIQDSIQKISDSIKLASQLREDSIKALNIKDSLLLANQLDSIKCVNDSLKAVKKRIDDSIKALTIQPIDTSQLTFSKPVNIKLDLAKKLFDKGYKFIDSRDSADYQAGHIRGAINIPFKKFQQYKHLLNNFSKDEVIVVYCGSDCDVSIDMAYAMAREGFKKMYIFHGGWDEWKNVNYPTN